MGRRFLSLAYESQSEPATSSPRAPPPPAALSSSPPPSPPATTRRAQRPVSSTARTLDPELAAIRAETSAALESVSNRLQNLRALLLAASSLNMNAQPSSEPTPESADSGSSGNSGAEPGADVAPGHAAIVITPADAAVQTNSQPPLPSSVTFSQGQDDPRTTLARRLLDGPSPSSSQQQPVTQRLVDAVREIRATIDRAPGLAERIGRIAAATAPEPIPPAASTLTPERRRAAAATAAPVLFEFQQRRAARASRVAQTASAIPVDAAPAQIEPPAPVPTLRRVRYNADGEEVPVGTATSRALDGRPLFHVVGGRPRPIPRSASAETIILPESPRDSDGEADTIMDPPYWTPPRPRAHPHQSSQGSELVSRLLQVGSLPTAGSSSRRNGPDASDLTYSRWRDAMGMHMNSDAVETQTAVPIGDSPPVSPALRRQYVRPLAPPLAPAGISDSAWRTRMEFLTSNVNLPLGDNVSSEVTRRSASPLRSEAASASRPPVVQREEPPPLIPCPLPQPLEDLTSDEEEGSSTLQPGALYW